MARPASFTLMSPLLAAMVLAALTLTPAFADALTGNYYILPVGHPDVERGIDGLVTGLVQSALGPNGLPVVSAFGMTDNGASHPITDMDATTHEILWWTPGQDGVTTWKTGQIDNLPFNLSLFPNDSGCDGGGVNPTTQQACGGYVAAYWTGTFNLAAPGQVTFNLGSDDDVWIFVDGILQVDDGGVHALSIVPAVTTPLTGGVHDISVFFADRHTVLSAINLTADVTFTPSVPEPGSIALLGTALVLVAGRFSRRKNAA